MNLDNTKAWFEITQKSLIIIGLVVGAWLFLLKEESSPHVKLSLTSEIMPECIIRIDTKIENKGGRVWSFDTAIARIFLPSTQRIINLKDEKLIEVGTQIIKTNQTLRVGEASNIGFNIKPKSNNSTSFYVIKVAITIKEEGNQWFRLSETSLKSGGC